MNRVRRPRWRGPPLALQIMALLVGGLAVAQIVTLMLTLLLPPAPVSQYGLDDIAAALLNEEGADLKRDGLERIVQPGPPDVNGPGWLVSERSRSELAQLIGADRKRVTLAFYTPMPFAGVAAARDIAIAEGSYPSFPDQAEPVGVRQARLVPMPTAAHEEPVGPPIAITPTRRSLFGLAPAPFVEGDFVASLKLADGRWAVVQPSPAPFPNRWQRRVLLWFVIALGVVVPLGWLFARRLVTPLQSFAQAAEQLGRAPTAAIVPLDGPAEIGRAAHAFNLMQRRLRAFVDDRTTMIGAISHDLRTPLTRMRFRIEDVNECDVRDGLLEEVEEMEAMITQVIEFIRDASAPGTRERLDLRVVVDDAAEDARLIGGDVTIEHAEFAPVEVDVLGMRRLLDNLLENALKYGERARIRLRTDAESIFVDIIDDGPGVPGEELERVFEPFYRGEEAVASEKKGSGLGLAVCRSIARAHGGDVRLVRDAGAFKAELCLPRAFGDAPPIA